jgi:hypothetical protein
MHVCGEQMNCPVFEVGCVNLLFDAHSFSPVLVAQQNLQTCRRFKISNSVADILDVAIRERDFVGRVADGLCMCLDAIFLGFGDVRPNGGNELECRIGSLDFVTTVPA